MATVPGKNSTIKEQYQKFIGRKVTFILILIPLLFILAGLAASLGSANVSIWDAYSAFLHRFLPNYFESSRLAEICVWKLRLPRILMGVAAGFGLGVAGCVMQGRAEESACESLYAWYCIRCRIWRFSWHTCRCRLRRWAISGNRKCIRLRISGFVHYPRSFKS